MKLYLKNLAVFLFLGIVFSALAGCGAGGAGNTATADAPKNTAPPAAKKSDYPPVPAAIMQAGLKGLDGNTFKIEDYKGKVVLINLWATWCGPCRGEMPHLVELQAKHKDKGFEILGLDVDEDETAEQIKSFAEEMKLNYTLAWVDGKTYAEFLKVSKFGGIPQSFLINREGQLIGVFTGGSPKVVAQLKENVDKAMSE